MIDIAKCQGTDCARRDTCLRYTMPERHKYQNWIFMKVAIPDPIKCKFHWEIVDELCEDTRPSTD